MPTISIRLTPGEYQAFLDFYHVSGHKSLSNMIRDLVIQRVLIRLPGQARRDELEQQRARHRPRRRRDSGRGQ